MDHDQRSVIDIIVKYGKNFVKSRKNNTEKPAAPLLMVHGGARSGKSHVIDTLAQIMEKIFRTPGDDPNHPCIHKTTFTENAAFIIKGQPYILHSAFHLVMRFCL